MSRGESVDLKTAFTSQSLAAFVSEGMDDLRPAHRANIRAQLRNIAEALAPFQPSSSRAALGPADPSVPYSAEEIDELRSWARALKPIGNRADARTLLSLGLGMGLSSSELGGLRHSDMTVDDRGIHAQVHGSRARRVTCLRDWEIDLQTIQKTEKSDRFVFRPEREADSKNLISNFAARSSSPVKLSTQRMRATWIVGHMDAGTHMATLLGAAGVASLEAFSRYLPFLAERSDEAVEASLRGLHRG